MAVVSQRAMARARRQALARLAESTHWLTIKQVAALVPCDPRPLRAWLAEHPPPCAWCPVYRRRGNRPAYRVLSPLDVGHVRRGMLTRRYPKR
jgi:hypothetical protein